MSAMYRYKMKNKIIIANHKTKKKKKKAVNVKRILVLFQLKDTGKGNRIYFLHCQVKKLKK